MLMYIFLHGSHNKNYVYTWKLAYIHFVVSSSHLLTGWYWRVEFLLLARLLFSSYLLDFFRLLLYAYAYLIDSTTQNKITKKKILNFLRRLLPLNLLRYIFVGLFVFCLHWLIAYYFYRGYFDLLPRRTWRIRKIFGNSNRYLIELYIIC